MGEGEKTLRGQNSEIEITRIEKKLYFHGTGPIQAEPILARSHPSTQMLATRALRSFATAMTGQPLTLSPRLLRRTTQGILNDIDLIVYDMAGTTVEEGGQVREVNGPD